jgi:predicted  nucleic acid-binding Zn-ribbon protein
MQQGYHEARALVREGQIMKTEEDLDRQLKDVLARIDEIRRELKALRRNASEGSKGRTRPDFLAGRQRIIEAQNAAEKLDKLKQQEQEIRAKLRLGDG